MFDLWKDRNKKNGGLEMIRFIARQRLRFNEGLSLLSVANFCLILVAASDKISLVTGIEPKYVCLFAPLGLVAMWAIGWFLMDKIKLNASYDLEQAARSPTNKRLFDELFKMREQLDRIEEEQNRREE